MHLELRNSCMMERQQKTSERNNTDLGMMVCEGKRGWALVWAVSD